LGIVTTLNELNMFLVGTTILSSSGCAGNLAPCCEIGVKLMMTKLTYTWRGHMSNQTHRYANKISAST
jgi:hypothetical protein